MYLITRDDLSPGYQAVQSSHALANFIFDHPIIAKIWHDKYKTIVNVSVANELELYNLSSNLKNTSISYSQFLEPDIGYAITAIALCGEGAKEFCKELPTAFRLHGKSIKDTKKYAKPTLDYNTILSASSIEKSTKQVIRDMVICRQNKEQNILEHGISVRDYAFDLIGVLKGSPPKFNWSLPGWLIKNKDLILRNLLDDFIIDKYTIFHDCGKPYCLTNDNHGQHFVDHANVSYLTYMTKCYGIKQVGELIRMDMDIHLLKAEGVPEFAARREAATLLLVGLAELHSNANMFGGLDSENFKIKYKQIDRRGKAICSAISQIENFFVPAV